MFTTLIIFVFTHNCKNQTNYSPYYYKQIELKLSKNLQQLVFLYSHIPERIISVIHHTATNKLNKKSPKFRKHSLFLYWHLPERIISVIHHTPTKKLNKQSPKLHNI